MLWRCFAASGNGGRDFINGMMKSDHYQSILEAKLLIKKLGFEVKIFDPSARQSEHTSRSRRRWTPVTPHCQSGTQSHWETERGSRDLQT